MVAGSFLSFSDRNIPLTNIDIPVFHMGLDKYSLTMKKGKSEQVRVNQFSELLASWSSSDEKVATVDKFGCVTAKGPGRARITVQAGPKTMYVNVLVPNNQAKSKSLKVSEDANVYEKLNGAKDINVLVVGDSIARGKFVEKLKNKLEKTYFCQVNMDNLALSGTCYSGAVSAVTRNHFDHYDLAIVCFGDNDKFKTFQSNYEGVVRKIQQTYGCEIIPVIESPLKATPSKIRVIQNICSYYGLTPADVATAFAKSGKSDSQLLTRSGHPNNAGHKIYAKTIMKVITDKVKIGAFDKTPVTEAPMTDGSEIFNHITYIKAADMTRVDDLTYTIKAPVSGLVGLDVTYTIKPRTFWVNYYINGRPNGPSVHTAKDTTKADNRHMWSVSTARCQKGDTIKVVFKDKRVADKFYGTVITSA